ncbi:MAG: hypothetical protein ACRC1T_09685 [Clostridium chrysemydis]|uniref:hypothetical protein n=1 Tax=Clostridium chrysemydis TaxID=2665504 RepID=UPI003F2F1942
MNNLKVLFLLLCGIIVTYTLSIAFIFGLALIPSMGIAWIIKTFFVVKYTFWQIAISIAIGLSILGGRFK